MCCTSGLPTAVERLVFFGQSWNCLVCFILPFFLPTRLGNKYLGCTRTAVWVCIWVHWINHPLTITTLKSALSFKHQIKKPPRTAGVTYHSLGYWRKPLTRFLPAVVLTPLLLKPLQEMPLHHAWSSEVWKLCNEWVIFTDLRQANWLRVNTRRGVRRIWVIFRKFGGTVSVFFLAETRLENIICKQMPKENLFTARGTESVCKCSENPAVNVPSTNCGSVGCKTPSLHLLLIHLECSFKQDSYSVNHHLSVSFYHTLSVSLCHTGHFVCRSTSRLHPPFKWLALPLPVFNMAHVQIC